MLGPNGKKIIEPDKTAPRVAQYFEMMGTGRHSLDDITRIARDDGMRSKKDRPIPKATWHNVFHNALYAGDVVWHGTVYRGTHTPLISRELFDRVQDVIAGRFADRTRKSIHDFTFTRLIRCGHCGCALAAELKKQRYIYYHCTGFKGRCPEPYTREEVFDERFAAVLERFTFDDEVIAWVTQALRESHSEEKRYHDEAVARLEAERDRLQQRLDAAYDDKLDGRIDAATFDRKAGEWRAEQAQARASLERHATANRSYLEEGILTLELANTAAALYRNQSGPEKRKLLDFERWPASFGTKFATRSVDEAL